MWLRVHPQLISHASLGPPCLRWFSLTLVGTVGLVECPASRPCCVLSAQTLVLLYKGPDSHCPARDRCRQGRGPGWDFQPMVPPQLREPVSRWLVLRADVLVALASLCSLSQVPFLL